MPQFCYAKLRGRIREIFGTQRKFASALGIGYVSLSMRLNNRLEFSQGEISLACKLLDISLNDIFLYFFNEKVQKNEQKNSITGR